ncbi:Na+/H+ antiporter subunit E [Pseudomonas typographi]|uniref:Na+/H+ antiporter subunit E n=1 Tax=Pseudomonas typographi TaxID=2715964 RepID=A0ABR7Z7F6_9PSED|nr:Na+/H+ antiporter subunit E [Pseudomonas typographi]MBD1554031.1 Na+/H+ antiporter subunit E [Pseudomonas typographi]MBD1589224.1 Na+/H+ antiporter subunit E [Pseudomonas typographi]MBD1601253.1 Na+/H+ antiporter subunit E [Pseudomonas typographi]
MNRWLPTPWLSLGLWALWLVLNASLSTGHLLLGALIGWGAPRLMAPLRPRHARIARPWLIVRLLARVAIDMVHANLQVLGTVLGPQPSHSRFVSIPLALRDPHALAALAAICAVVPGTVWSQLSADRSTLLMHVLVLVGDEAAFIRRFKATYEQPLLEIFP